MPQVCHSALETLDHVCWSNLLSKEVWGLVDLQELLNIPTPSIIEWFTSNFQHYFTTQRRTVCCTLWILWFDRKKRVHKSVSKSGRELIDFIFHYLKEIDDLVNVRHTRGLTGRNGSLQTRDGLKLILTLLLIRPATDLDPEQYCEISLVLCWLVAPQYIMRSP